MTNIKKLTVALLLFSSIIPIAQAQSTWEPAKPPAIALVPVDDFGVFNPEGDKKAPTTRPADAL